GKSRRHRALLPHRVPAAMIEVQMGIDDDVDVLRTHAAGRKIVEQLRRLAVNLHHLFRQLVADPSLDENVLFAGANEQRIEPGDDEIFLIRDQLARPHDLGHDSEERSSVERIGSSENTLSSKSPSVIW